MTHLPRHKCSPPHPSLGGPQEDSPFLGVYEHADGEVFSAADGTIHPDFRLFATASPQRPGAHNLSAAFYSRVIHICLPPLDAGLTADNAASHDFTALLRGMLAGVRGGGELAELCTRHHAAVVALAATRQLTPGQGFGYTARNPLRVARHVAALAQRPYTGTEPAQDSQLVKRAAYSLLVSYGNSLDSLAQRAVVARELGVALQSPNLRQPAYELAASPNREAEPAAWEAGAKPLAEAVAEAEACAAAFLWSALRLLDGVPGQAAVAARMVAEVLLPCYPEQETELKALHKVGRRVGSLLVGAARAFSSYPHGCYFGLPVGASVFLCRYRHCWPGLTSLSPVS
jgi:hypothetical protein